MLQIQLASMNFFIPCDNWKRLCFIKVYRYSEIFFNCHVVAFIRTSVLKDIRILRHLRNNNRILIPKFQEKTVVHCII